MALVCCICHKEFPKEDILVNTTENNEQRLICKECFKKEVGVDYNTFQYRKENAKSISIAVIFSLGISIYAFLEKGIGYGFLGLIFTILIYYFGFKTKK